MWLKYAPAPITMADYTDRAQAQPRADGYRSDYEKPKGCWITDDSDDCWNAWCVAESFELRGLTHKHEVILDESGVLSLCKAYELDDFTAEFGVDIWWGTDEHPRKYKNRCIAWEKVAAKYDGLIITPYIWQRRMELNWYYTWDCASGCIWNVRAIKDIRLIETVESKETKAA